MRALEFAGLIRGNSMNFGLLKREALVAKLRALADRIEKNEKPHIVLQEAHSCESAKVDEFSITTLVLQFAEMGVDAKPGTKLYGSDSQFPVEVKREPEPAASTGIKL